MKGWRPSAARFESRIGLFSSGRTLAGHRIDRSVFFHGSSVPWAHDAGSASWTPGFPCSRNEARGRQVGQMASASHKGENPRPKSRQPFTCSMRPGQPKRRQDGRETIRSEQATSTPPRRLEAPNWPKKKKCPGGSAQAFEKARFGEGNPRIFFDLFWPGFAG